MHCICMYVYLLLNSIMCVRLCAPCSPQGAFIVSYESPTAQSGECKQMLNWATEWFTVFSLFSIRFDRLFSYRKWIKLIFVSAMQMWTNISVPPDFVHAFRTLFTRLHLFGPFFLCYFVISFYCYFYLQSTLSFTLFAHLLSVIRCAVFYVIFYLLCVAFSYWFR